MAAGEQITNREIDAALIGTGTWEINPDFGISELNRYLAELDLRDRGIPYEDLGIGNRRHQQLPSVIDQAGQVINTGGNSILNNTTQRSFAHLRLEGVMRLRDGLSSRGIRQLTEDIRAAENNPTISGILLEVDSGGGEAQAGTMLNQAIEEAKKPIVVFARTMASAALKGALPADRIIAAGPDATIGSIGTMVSINTRAVEFYRQNFEDIYADQSSNKNNEFREYLKGNRGPIIERLNTHNETFIQEVQRWRELKGSEEAISQALAGAVYDGRQAATIGLVDQVGSFTTAINELAGLAGQPNFSRRQPANNSQNFKKMDFTQMLSRIRTRINNSFGTELPENAGIEQIEAAIEQAAQSHRQELDQRLGALQAAVDNLPEVPDTASLEDRLATIEAAIQELNNRQETTAAEVVQLKGGRLLKKEVNSQVPNKDQFETARIFGQTVSPPGNSKY